MSAADLPLKFDHRRVAAFCQARGIRRLSLFGSVLRSDFDFARSDVDVLADFEPAALRGVGLRYFDFGVELAEILGRRVDFCSRLDPLLAKAVEQELLPIYEQA